MNNLKNTIDNQLEINKGKNLFYNELYNSLKFAPSTIKAIERIGKIDKDSENLLLDYLTNKVLQEFCRVNQYYSFNNQAQIDLRNIYVQLFSNIKSKRTSIDSISKTHYNNLITWLQTTNSFAKKMYTSKEEVIGPAACSEYNSDLQIEILQIDLTRITVPVLDIGCGKQGNLVSQLRQNGIEAYGFDRFANNNLYLTISDWFEYEYGIEKWGTIISNLGFANHFTHHHLRTDGNFIGYAKKYMDILRSLKVGGSFHYTPDLPFIEQYLDDTKYKVLKHKVGKYNFKSSKITRIIR